MGGVYGYLRVFLLLQTQKLECLSVSGALWQFCSAPTTFSLWDLYLFFPLLMQKFFTADCEIFHRKQNKTKKTNYRAIPIQKPAFNMEISCHFFILKCTWCTNANVRITCSISHNRKQYVCYTWTRRSDGERWKQIFFSIITTAKSVMLKQKREKWLPCTHTDT